MGGYFTIAKKAVPGTETGLGQVPVADTPIEVFPQVIENIPSSSEKMKSLSFSRLERMVFRKSLNASRRESRVTCIRNTRDEACMFIVGWMVFPMHNIDGA